MRHVSVISEDPICTGFRGLTSCQRDPWDRGVADGGVWATFFDD